MLDMTKGSIKKHIKTLAIPVFIGSFFSTMYNVVDTFYAGLISTEALAALGASFPIFFIIIALGGGVSTGATALISNAMGEKKQKKIQTYTAQSISYTIIIGLVLTVLGLFVSPYLFSTMVSGQTAVLAGQYMNVILFGGTILVLMFTLNSILTCSGDTKTFRNVLIIGFILNLILNPALVYGWFTPALGFSGIALATVIIWTISVIYMGYKVARLGIICKGCWKLFKPNRKPFLSITQQGMPASLNMMTIALGIFIITYFVAMFGDEGVAAYGIATRIEQIAMLPLSGLNIAVLTIVGQNNGAKKFARIKDTLKTGLKYGIIATAITSVTMFLFSYPLMEFFTKDMAVVSIGGAYLKIAAFVGWAYIILFLIVAALQGLKKPMYALWIGLYRQILAPVVIFFIVTTLGFGLMGIWWGVFAVTWSAALITLIYAKNVMGKLR